MAYWSQPHQDSNHDCLGFGKSVRLFHSANWAMDQLKNTKNLKICTMSSFWERATHSTHKAHRLLADRNLDDGICSQYCFLLPSESYVAGSRVVNKFTLDGMKVRLWKSLIWSSKQRMQDFIHWYSLQGHMKSHEKERIHPIALSPNISSLDYENKSPSILICNEKKNKIFYKLWQYKSWTKKLV